LLLYDHVITLDKEIEWIWTLRWGLPKMIFIFNRYVATSLILLMSIPTFIFPLSISFCKFMLRLTWVPVLTFGATEFLLILRVCSLYGNHKVLVWSLRGIWAAAFGGSLALEVMFEQGTFPISGYEFLPGCFVESLPRLHHYIWLEWTACLLVEAIVVLLTAYKLFLYRNQMNATIALLARDSMVYFLIILGCILSNIISDLYPDLSFINTTVAAQCINSVAAGRMMMNVRGLILDDPWHTTVRLRTRQFAARDNIDLDQRDDEVVG